MNMNTNYNSKPIKTISSNLFCPVNKSFQSQLGKNCFPLTGKTQLKILYLLAENYELRNMRYLIERTKDFSKIKSAHNKAQ